MLNQCSNPDSIRCARYESKHRYKILQLNLYRYVKSVFESGFNQVSGSESYSALLMIHEICELIRIRIRL
jgi:hypothetical protein